MASKKNPHCSHAFRLLCGGRPDRLGSAASPQRAGRGRSVPRRSPQHSLRGSGPRAGLVVPWRARRGAGASCWPSLGGEMTDQKELPPVVPTNAHKKTPSPITRAQPCGDAAAGHVRVLPQCPLGPPARRGPHVEPRGARAGRNMARRATQADPGGEAHRRKMNNVHAERAPEAFMDPTDP
eukprot:scaffold30514_cov62-Phaeocystis_antarctica.AAC.1